jgi:hypothetical protein
MKSRDEHIDRMLCYLGLFIIGALGWTADRLSAVRAAWPTATRRPDSPRTIRTVKV